MEEALMILLLKVRGYFERAGRSTSAADLGYSKKANHVRNYMELKNNPDEMITRSANREQHIKLMLNVNPFSESIQARNESGLMDIIKQYREQDPLARKRGIGFSNLQAVVEAAIDRLDQNQLILRDVDPVQNSEHLKQVRRLLIRDAYFL